MDFRRIGALVAAALLLAAFAAPVAASDVTVGAFVQELAKARSLHAADPISAANALRGAGLALPGDLDFDRTLTEGDVVGIAAAAGLRVTTSQPGARFDRARVNSFFSTFATDLLAGPGADDGNTTFENPGQGSGPGNGNGGPPFDPFSKGKGKGSSKSKGHVSPDSPE